MLIIPPDPPFVAKPPGARTIPPGPQIEKGWTGVVAGSEEN